MTAIMYYFVLYHLGEEEEMRKEQLVDFRRVFSKIDPEIPVICVCGNPDVGDFPTKETVRIYREQFGQDYFVFCFGGLDSLY